MDTKTYNDQTFGIISFIVKAAVLLTFVSNASATVLSQCPPFDCSRGSFVTGFFTGQSSDGQISPELGSPLLTQATSNPDLSKLLGSGSGRASIVTNGQQVLSSLSTTTLTECADFCRSYNRQAASAGGILASYWTLTLAFQSDSNGGMKSAGKCLCYAPDVCIPSSSGDPVFENSATTAGRSSSVFTLSATGSLCTTNGKGDPHFTGADKSYFDFSGIPNKNFALISDRDLHVNAFFGGRYEVAPGSDRIAVRSKAMTWMRKIGIIWRSHSVILEAREGPEAEYGSGYLKSLVVDHRPVTLSQAGEKAKMTYADGVSMQITWLLAGEPDSDDLVDKYEVRVGDVLTLVLTLRPEVESLRTAEDGLVHFTVEVVEAKVSEDVHGIVGQTYRPDFMGRLEKQALVWNDLLKRNMVAGENGRGFLDGETEDYMVSDILATDCKVSRFSPATIASRVDSQMVSHSRKLMLR